MINTENQSAPMMAEQKQQIHDCLRKLVEIKLILQEIPNPIHPTESVWDGNCTGESWYEIRSNIAGIYIDYLEQEVSHE